MLDEKDIKTLQELLVTKTDLENFRDEYRKILATFKRQWMLMRLKPTNFLKS